MGGGGGYLKEEGGYTTDENIALGWGNARLENNNRMNKEHCIGKERVK